MVTRQSKPSAALVGSANLTKAGLDDNWEMMVRVTGSELPRVWEQLDSFLKGTGGNKRPWDAKEKLTKAVAKESATKAATPARRPAPSKPEPPPKPQPKRAGCLSAVARWALAIMVAVAILMTLGN